MPGDTERILLVGGTFDPPHRAHIELPAIAARSLGCTRIVYIPAARSPLKTDTAPTADEHRLAMLRLALRDHSATEISTIELARGGMSYFVDTLNALRADLGEKTELRFLIGADQAICFQQWKDWSRILEIAEPVVLLRPPWTTSSFRAALAREYGDAAEADAWMRRIVTAPLLDVSATEVRRRLAAGESVGDLLDEAVVEYIGARGLYSAGE